LGKVTRARAAAALLAATAAFSLSPGASGAEKEEPPRWRLDAGALAEYDLLPVTVNGKTGERKKGKAAPFGVFGHRLVDGRGPRPLQPKLADLGPAFALTVAPEAGGGKEALLFTRLGNLGPVEVSGKWKAKRRGDGKWECAADLSMRHRGKRKGKEFDRVLVDGTLTVSSLFDPERGVVESASYDLRARTIPDEGAVRDRKVAEVRKAGEFTFVRVATAGGEGWQEAIDGAIERGVKWLLDHELEKGRYPLYKGYPGGVDGLVALALFACDPERKAGDAALSMAMREEPTRTYQTAVTMMAIEMKRTPPGEAALLRSGKIEKAVRNLDVFERMWMEKGAEFLLETAAGRGKWHYPSKSHGGRFKPPEPDLSNSQYAVLGLLAAHRCGVEVEEGVWLGILRAFLQVQERDGPPVTAWFPSERERREEAAGKTQTSLPRLRARGWPYRSGDDSSATMTCAGIASIAIARDVLRETVPRRLTADLAADADRAIMDGFAWLFDRWTVEQAAHENGRPRNWLHYFLYALERAGILADVVRVGEHDWYGEGALHLLHTQHKDGWWTQMKGSKPRKVVDTCFALLFLKRAVTPVATR
jgi:hypothetical protein